MQFNDPFHRLAQYIEQEQHPVTVPARLIKPYSDIESVSKLLRNGWSAEYALRITPIVNDEQYLQSSLHWTFPQAYYSVLFTSRAMLLTMGSNLSNEALIRKKISLLVVGGLYPAPLATYVTGVPHLNLPPYRLNRALGDRGNLCYYQRRLCGVRTKLLIAKAKELQLNPRTALRNPSTGEPASVGKLSVENYKEIARMIGPTSWFDFMGTLRISSTNRELESVQLSAMDVRLFHHQLTTIVTRINTIHETAIACSLGNDRYRKLVDGEPTYIKKSFVKDRTYNLLNSIAQ